MPAGFSKVSMSASDHWKKAIVFPAPIDLLEALDKRNLVTPLLFRRGAGGAPAWARRLVRALGLVLLAFTLVRGKQAHYLLPAMPALSLWLAWRRRRNGRQLAARRQREDVPAARGRGERDLEA